MDDQQFKNSTIINWNLNKREISFILLKVITPKVRRGKTER